MLLPAINCKSLLLKLNIWHDWGFSLIKMRSVAIEMIMYQLSTVKANNVFHRNVLLVLRTRIYSLFALGVWRLRVEDLGQGLRVWCWKGGRPRLNIILKWSAVSQNRNNGIQLKGCFQLYSFASHNLQCPRNGSVSLYKHC